MVACFLTYVSAKYYKNPSMLSRVIAKNVGDVFFETQCICRNMIGQQAWKFSYTGSPPVITSQKIWGRATFFDSHCR